MAMDTKNKIYIGVIVAGVAAIAVLLGPDLLPSGNSSGSKQSGGNIIQKPNPTPRTIQVTPEDLRGELVARSPNQKEASQHAELALSLRNQEMLTRRAESRARQLEAELKEIQTQESIKRLQADDVEKLRQFSIQTGEGATGEANDPGYSSNRRQNATNAPTRPAQPETTPLENFRVVGIFKEGDEWVARITRGGSIERVKSGYVLDGEIEVQVKKERVELTRNDKTVSVYL